MISPLVGVLSEILASKISPEVSSGIPSRVASRIPPEILPYSRAAVLSMNPPVFRCGITLGLGVIF